jgi:hypothetical protein
MAVTFVVGTHSYVVPDAQSAILAENLRILARSDLAELAPSVTELASDGDWRAQALALANSVEDMLVSDHPRPLALEGGAAAPAYCVLRLMVGMESSAAAGLRDALGAPVAADDHPDPVPMPMPMPALRPRHLSGPEMRELLVVLFVLALLTFVAGTEWTGLWYVLAPMIAALLGLRVATTRATGRLAWTVASVVWWAVMLIPAAVLVVLVGLLVVSVS